VAPPIPQEPRKSVDPDPLDAAAYLASWGSSLTHLTPLERAALMRHLARTLDRLAREIEDTHAP
jgi:hypothetical protein